MISRYNIDCGVNGGSIIKEDCVFQNAESSKPVSCSVCVCVCVCVCVWTYGRVCGRVCMGVCVVILA